MKDATVAFARMIDADLKTVRTTVADPQWSNWIPFLKASQCNGIHAGSSRVCTMADPTGQMDGYQLQEENLENDSESGRFAYAISNPPLPVSGFTALIETQAVGEKTMLTWTANYQVDAKDAEMTKAALLGMYAGALEGMNQYVNGQNPRAENMLLTDA